MIVKLCNPTAKSSVIVNSPSLSVVNVSSTVSPCFISIVAFVIGDGVVSSSVKTPLTVTVSSV